MSLINPNIDPFKESDDIKIRLDGLESRINDLQRQLTTAMQTVGLLARAETYRIDRAKTNGK